MALDPALTAPLAAVAAAASEAAGHWWVIGSAAAALHGAEAGLVGDVDLLFAEPGDARRMLAGWGGRAVPIGDVRPL